MQVRLQSKTGPLILSGDDLLRSLREQTEALQSQWRDRLAHDPAGFAQLEVEIHDHFRRLADQMTASLLAQATTTHDQAEPGKKGVPTPPAAADAPPNRGTLKLRLLGGLVVWIATTYCAPKAGTAKRRGQEGTGHYPELAALGIRKGATPALQSQVGRLTALLPSIELVRDELRQQGPTLDEKTVHRMARQLGAEVLTAAHPPVATVSRRPTPGGGRPCGPARCGAGRWRAGADPHADRDEETQGGEASPQDPHRVARAQAPDPLSQRPSRPDAQGDAPLDRRDDERAGSTDGTAGVAPPSPGGGAGQDGLVRLRWRPLDLEPAGLGREAGGSGPEADRAGAGHLPCDASHQPGLEGAGPSRVRAGREVSGVASTVGAGRSREVVATLRALAQGQPEEAEVWVEIAFLEKHEPHMRYDWLKYRGRPLGSGAIESAMRRVINLRLKGNGIYWREESVEGMLVLRAAVLTGRWQEMMGAAHAAMGSDRRRDWQWHAPDMVEELNAGVEVKPLEPQLASSDQIEAIAA